MNLLTSSTYARNEYFHWIGTKLFFNDVIHNFHSLSKEINERENIFNRMGQENWWSCIQVSENDWVIEGLCDEKRKKPQRIDDVFESRDSDQQTRLKESLNTHNNNR